MCFGKRSVWLKYDVQMLKQQEKKSKKIMGTYSERPFNVKVEILLLLLQFIVMEAPAFSTAHM